jgi:hypothetical protein
VPERTRKLLDHIVRQYAVLDELRAVDLDAASSESGAAIESGKKEAARREVERANQLAEAFDRGLALAYRTRELALDDRDPEQNRIADALIFFLVRFDLATSRTEETEPLHYTYHVSVDWDRLGEVARAAGVDLDRLLQQTA